ncbi:NAD(P)H-dependent FMN reductase [Motilibacter rhizosphaerae]|uniref:NAD(P)H-dependent FMN reductase n=1 Tax=Motilibacter rhizosphaerae TaxID=598652 RepID=A0A4Q7NPX9_9ACTN|nr:NAD(P)H-dependent oxidoreductase [Motilibacter rhizosphaerae]RZS87339.1 NAD(P)H-dependent FMN reductase [Motilibacter rhizosphaerae]
MTTTTAPVPLRLAVVTGSSRSGRYAPAVTRWFVDAVGDRADLELDVLDVADLELPADGPALPPRSGQYDAPAAALAARLSAADAFVLVVPEYNHGYPAALKHAIDATYWEWAAKPVGFVSYGGAFGGVRAVEQLRQVVVELHGTTVRDQVAVPAVYAAFDQEGRARGEVPVIGDLDALLDQLLWWGRALRAARAEVPYAA